MPGLWLLLNYYVIDFAFSLSSISCNSLYRNRPLSGVIIFMTGPGNAFVFAADYKNSK
ncbi:hypothetical protein CLOSTHATH_02410 [Hungatella hathewayi DSM 13479]|uniref:Uncharacterized protein n=1 Tax=Hungatella hathewayi DSM 13479 TaxID=566550 RepID=D3AFM5_9FIRM|nr:hypothetical protein CLOSTHATH_02410 [Hungatella hathewayi DSM 13479]